MTLAVLAVLALLSVAVIRKVQTPETITISMVGDIMLSRWVQPLLEEHGYDYPYEQVQEIFLQDDLTIGNLECPITDASNPVNKTKRFLFRADEENALAMKQAGFDCLNLANNHSMDYRSDGLTDTMENLKKYGLSYMGAAEDAFSHQPYIFEKNGIRVGFLAYSTFPPEGYFQQEDQAAIRYIGDLNLEILEEDMEKLEECDFAVVYFHWGLEYRPYHSESQEMLARKAIDCGADFVVGAHPHVLQDQEVYQDKHIYYSLGNFIFDKQIPPGTDETVILQMTIGKQGLTDIQEIPITIEQGQAVLQS